MEKKRMESSVWYCVINKSEWESEKLEQLFFSVILLSRACHFKFFLLVSSTELPQIQQIVKQRPTCCPRRKTTLAVMTVGLIKHMGFRAYSQQMNSAKNVDD